MQRALTGGLFEPEDTPEQKPALARLETALALVEGWVDEVVDAAATTKLPAAAALRETVRRRRATGGPAEATFASLVGLELRPRRLREAAALWRAVLAERGQDGREAVWAHPDLLPGCRRPRRPGRLRQRRRLRAAGPVRPGRHAGPAGARPAVTALHDDAVRGADRLAGSRRRPAAAAVGVPRAPARATTTACCSSCVPAHLTASAMVLDHAGERVLLTLHRKGGFWGQLGGHCEPGRRHARRRGAARGDRGVRHRRAAAGRRRPGRPGPARAVLGVRDAAASTSTCGTPWSRRPAPSRWSATSRTTSRGSPPTRCPPRRWTTCRAWSSGPGPRCRRLRRTTGDEPSAGVDVRVVVGQPEPGRRGHALEVAAGPLGAREALDLGPERPARGRAPAGGPARAPARSRRPTAASPAAGWRAGWCGRPGCRSPSGCPGWPPTARCSAWPGRPASACDSSPRAGQQVLVAGPQLAVLAVQPVEHHGDPLALLGAAHPGRDEHHRAVAVAVGRDGTPAARRRGVPPTVRRARAPRPARSCPKR